LTEVSEVHTASNTLILEAVRISEMSVNFNVTTWRCTPEDYKLNKDPLELTFSPI
jgi:hypothetical protein